MGFIWIQPHNNHSPRGKCKDAIVLTLELTSFINTVFVLLKLYLSPSKRGPVTTLSPPSPLCLQTENCLTIQVDV